MRPYVLFALLALCALCAPAMGQDLIDGSQDGELDRLVVEWRDAPPLPPPPPPAWETYGIKKKINIAGHGPCLPRSVNRVTVKSNVGVAKPLLVVVGVVQTDIHVPYLGLNFYAVPWLLEMPFLPPPSNPMVDIEFMLPGSAPIGFEMYFQAFGQNLLDEWSCHSQGLVLRVQ